VQCHILDYLTQVWGMISLYLVSITPLFVTWLCWKGKGDIFGDSVQDMYLSERLMPGTESHVTQQPVIRVTDGSTVGKSCYAVTAISYCDLHKISLDDLAAILDVYPEFASQFLHDFYITFSLRQVRSTVPVHVGVYSSSLYVTSKVKSPVNNKNPWRSKDDPVCCSWQSN